ncbi:PD-(D/E)XK nuclease family protein [Xenorhabdus sp. SF857]|uniref:PD-(D/E)XK nuclease family protein n=1 Tax=Xenorhabdus bakwenae TaxID=3026967 RepID=UPI0025581AA2|nr:PD-(D/E)XK nuclease family protein [Xenorhabdus sp. SF857]WFQ79435.1 PD-(D/E)XK nuclease family protein [Xenorhabdus sp. SF857]
MNKLTDDFFQKLKKITLHEERKTNFFTSGGTGYLENPTSDLLALFMGNRRDVPPWLLKALMQCLNVDSDIDDLDITSLEVTRETRTSDGKYLDILISHQDFIIGIEHKTISAINNPFESYEKHLNSFIDNSQMVYRCILAPDSLPCLPVAKWPLLSYSQLVTTARSRLGQDQARVPFSKWNIFYTEFLNHLYELSGVNNTMVMNTENQNFVKEHFNLLLKARDLLKEFEAAMIDEGKKTLAEVLPGTNISHRINNWKGDYKAIHLAPECWGNGKTGVSLVYYPSEDEQDVIYYVNGWINICDCPELATLRDVVLEKMKSDAFLPSADKSDSEIIPKAKELILSFGTPEGSLEEAKLLLKEMAMLISEVLESQIVTDV